MALTQEVEAEALYRQADKNDDKLWIYGGCVKDATDALGALYKYFLKRIKLNNQHLFSCLKKEYFYD